MRGLGFLSSHVLEFCWCEINNWYIPFKCLCLLKHINPCYKVSLAGFHMFSDFAISFVWLLVNGRCWVKCKVLSDLQRLPETKCRVSRPQTCRVGGGEQILTGLSTKEEHTTPRNDVSSPVPWILFGLGSGGGQRMRGRL